MKKLIIVLFLCLVLGVGLSWAAGSKLIAPSFARVGNPPATLVSENIVYENVHGWFFPAKTQDACLLLMHGVRANRTHMVNRVNFLVDAGYSAFAVDLQAHGETPGTAISFGFIESKSAASAVKFLRQEKNCTKIVALGSSLGGAASLLGNDGLQVDGYILESVYPGIELAVKNRLKIRFGEFGQLFAPLIYMQIPARLGIPLRDLQPSEAIRKLKSPVLIMNGSDDKRTTIRDAEQLYRNAPEPKLFIKVNGAKHQDLYRFQPEAYRKNVLEFLSKYIVRPIHN